MQSPARTGYTFTGWFDAETGGNKVESIAKGSTGAKTLYAQWTAISYEITYVLPNSVTNPNVTSYTIESNTITLQSPARTGYTFNGWFDAETGGNKVERIAQGSTGAKTLYATWTPNTLSPITITLGKVEADQELTVSLSDRTFTATSGFALYEWHIDGVKVDGAEGSTYTADQSALSYGNHSLMVIAKDSNGSRFGAEATFTVNKNVCKVTFDTKGGSTVADKLIYADEHIEKPADPTKKGYTFEGWFNGENEFDFDTAVTENITLTAKWAIITYTITYEDLDGAENPNTITSYTVESETIILQNPSKEGYIFQGWYDAEIDGNKESIAQGSTGDITLYAQWWTFSLQVTGTPSKTLYYVGDSLDTTGLTVTATYSDGNSNAVTDITVPVFTEVNLGTKQTLTISYTEGGLTKTADVSGTFYVAASGAKPAESPVALTDYTGTLEGGTYYAFGDFPQTISTLTGENAYTSEPVYNGWYLGSDGYFYAKCTENAFIDILTYSDGTPVAQASANSTKYFRVEPIKWRVLNPSASGNKILLAESILTVHRFDDDSNNYKESEIRTYLNDDFLNAAFTSTAHNLIATTIVDNSAASTNPASNEKTWSMGTNNYACENTSDKIFLLSEKEVTTSAYEFTEYNEYGEGNSRIRVTTDYAKANFAVQDAYGGLWWLRSPNADYSNNAHYIFQDGSSYNYCNVISENVGVVPALCLSSQE